MRQTTSATGIAKHLAGALVAYAFLLVMPVPAAAHVSQTVGGPVAGVPISEITHGQMPVIARHTREILALAARQPGPSDDFQRLLNYARVQRAYCLWGLVPGSISDEASPFNACSHAYIAALRELLLRMNADPANAAADALVREVDTDMLMSATALEFCNYSAMPYDTATLVRPLWDDLIWHPMSLASLLALAGMVLALTLAFLRWLGRQPNNPTVSSGVATTAARSG